MDNLPPLVLYINGSRGDFLYSVLFGDVLKTCWQSHTVHTPNSYGIVRKIHRFGPIHSHQEVVDRPEDLLKYRTIRISAPTEDQQQQIAKLWYVKQRMLSQQTGSINRLAASVQEWENTYKQYDDLCYKIFEFRDLFDLNKLNNTHMEINNLELTDTQKYQVQYNIDLNLNLLEAS